MPGGRIDYSRNLVRPVASSAGDDVTTRLTTAREVFAVDADVPANVLDWPARVAVELDGHEFEVVGAGLILGNTPRSARAFSLAAAGELTTSLEFKVKTRSYRSRVNCGSRPILRAQSGHNLEFIGKLAWLSKIPPAEVN